MWDRQKDRLPNGSHLIYDKDNCSTMGKTGLFYKRYEINWMFLWDTCTWTHPSFTKHKSRFAANPNTKVNTYFKIKYETSF